MTLQPEKPLLLPCVGQRSVPEDEERQLRLSRFDGAVRVATETDEQREEREERLSRRRAAQRERVRERSATDTPEEREKRLARRRTDGEQGNDALPKAPHKGRSD